MKPAPKAVKSYQLNKSWNRWIKKKLGLNVDMYLLKHTNSTETADMIGTALAAKHNKHSEQILKSNYDIGGKEREEQLLKGVDNAFVPKKNLNS